MNCPCMNCPYRKPICHDHCEDYLEWHDTLLAAKDALRVADKAISLLADGVHKRKDKWVKKGEKV